MLLRTLDDLQMAFTEAGLPELFNDMRQHARNRIVIEVDSEFDTQALGASRFGGEPDLPPDVEWFTNPTTGAPLSFVAQLNFAELKAFDIDNQLPDQGILYFFYDVEAFPWGFDPKNGAGSRVYFYDGQVEQLEKRPSPIEIVRFSSSRLIFSSQIDLPEYSSWLIDYPLTDDKYERYLDLIDELELEVDHKLLGHSFLCIKAPIQYRSGALILRQQ